MAGGEAALFFDKGLAKDFDYRCKQAGQLASKMRFLAAPWLGLLEGGAWMKNARACQCLRKAPCGRGRRPPGFQADVSGTGERGVPLRRRGPAAGVARSWLAFL